MSSKQLLAELSLDIDSRTIIVHLVESERKVLSKCCHWKRLLCKVELIVVSCKGSPKENCYWKWSRM